MHCFLLGITDFLGSHVAEGLLARGDFRVSPRATTKSKIGSGSDRNIQPYREGAPALTRTYAADPPTVVEE